MWVYYTTNDIRTGWMVKYQSFKQRDSLLRSEALSSCTVEKLRTLMKCDEYRGNGGTAA